MKQAVVLVADGLDAVTISPTAARILNLPSGEAKASEFADVASAGHLLVTLLRATAQGMLVPLVLCEAVRDPDGRVGDLVICGVNHAACEFLGRSEANLLGRSAAATFPNLQTSGVIEWVGRCLEDGEPIELDDHEYFSDVHDDSRRYDVRVAWGGDDLIVCTWRDVTERLQYLERLAASEERYRLLVENAGDVVCHIRDDKIVWITSNVESMQGPPAESWIGRDVSEIVLVKSRGVVYEFVA